MNTRIISNTHRDTSRTSQAAMMTVTATSQGSSVSARFYNSASEQSSVPYIGTGLVPKYATLLTIPLGGDDQLRVAVGYRGYSYYNSTNSET